VVVVVNVIFAIIGIAFMAAAGYAMGTYADFGDLMSSTGLTILLAMGAFLFVTALCGCIGAMKQNKLLLMGYCLFLLIVIVIQLVSGALIASYAGVLDLAKKVDDVGIPVDETVTDAEKEIYKDIDEAVKCTYKYCCKETYDIGDIDCGETFTKESDTRTAMCDLVKEISPNPCAASDIDGFRDSFVEWARFNVDTLGIAVIAVGAVQFLALVFTCFLMCSNKDQFEGASEA
jgi:hypothetical protein